MWENDRRIRFSAFRYSKKFNKRAAVGCLFYFVRCGAKAYFCSMAKSVRCSVVFVFLFASLANAQIRLDKLEIKAKQEYIIEGSDVLVVDTLIMRDSSRIILNREKRETIINAKVLIANKGAQIIGNGLAGENGKTGANGARQIAPCRVGGHAKEGSSGARGNDGLNLSLYVNQLTISGSLIIDLNGGNGGNGGKGGRGGDGGGGTRVCRGGNGGIGGNGGNGGDGGNAGKLVMRCTQCQNLHVLDQLFIKNYGGFAGFGANGGAGGLAGLGTNGDGKNGAKGVAGINGVAGKQGVVTFEKK